MKKIILLSFVFLTCNQLLGQSKLGNEWITGGGGQRIKFIDTIIKTSNSHIILSYFINGNSNICDTSGNIILCSDGYNIYDSNANFIDGGDTLVPLDFYIDQGGWSGLSQSSIFLPIDSEQYYFINPTMSDIRYADCKSGGSCFFDLLLYNVIDMKANGGAGKVVKRMIPLMQNEQLSKTQMMACRHGNGKDWWLLKQGGDSNIVYKFLFTQDSVYDYGRQVFNDPIFGPWDLEGQSVFNADGNKYATTVKSFDNPGLVSIFDFDRCYGDLSNLKVIHAPPVVFPPDTTKFDMLTTGLAYSTNGRFLYVALQYDIYQYDTQDTTWFLVAGMDTSYAQFQGYTTIYLGPNEKLYIGNFGGGSKQMSVINSPDVKGAGCNFCPRCLRLDTLGTPAWVGTPPCMPNYGLGAKVCFPLSISEYANGAMSQLEVYPNPARTILFIKTKSKAPRELYNSIGQLIFSTNEDVLDVSRFDKGIYYLKCGSGVKKVIIE